MNEDFVTYEQALALKKLGFDWYINFYYLKSDYISQWDTANNWNRTKNCISAPTLAQAQKWLRIKYKVFVTSDIRFKDYYKGNFSNPEYQYITVDMRKSSHTNRIESDYNRGKLFNSPEEALLAGITECINILNKE